MSGPYSAGWRSEDRPKGTPYHCVDGPGSGFGYHGGTLWPHWSLPSKELAESCAEMCNAAYKRGREDQQAAIRKELGL